MNFLVSLFSATIFCFLFIYGTADSDDVQNIQENICECIDYDCGCCVPIHIRDIMHGILCSNFSYLPKTYGISATITYNSKTLINKTITATNPPPICIIYFEKLNMNICLRFYNLNYTNCFSGCAEVEINFFDVLPIRRLKLGCFGCKYSNYSNNYVLNTFYRIKSEVNPNRQQPEIVLI